MVISGRIAFCVICRRYVLEIMEKPKNMKAFFTRVVNTVFEQQSNGDNLFSADFKSIKTEKKVCKSSVEAVKSF